jgi:hypothetical protein
MLCKVLVSLLDPSKLKWKNRCIIQTILTVIIYIKVNFVHTIIIKVCLPRILVCNWNEVVCTQHQCFGYMKCKQVTGLKMANTQG